VTLGLFGELGFEDEGRPRVERHVRAQSRRRKAAKGGARRSDERRWAWVDVLNNCIRDFDQS